MTDGIYDQSIFPVMNVDEEFHCCNLMADENRIRSLNGQSGLFIFVDCENYKWTMKDGLTFTEVKFCTFCGREL